MDEIRLTKGGAFLAKVFIPHDGYVLAKGTYYGSVEEKEIHLPWREIELIEGVVEDA